MTIEKKDWHTCILCEKDIKDLSKIYGGSGIYYTKVFSDHLKNDHGISPEEYFEKISERPLCSCGECKKVVDLVWKGKNNFSWRKYKCGKNDGVKKWSKWAKHGRSGENNPMYGKDSWNKNKTKYDSDIIMKISQKMTNRHISDITKQRQSKSAKARKIHGHTGHRHSEESKNKMRIATLNAIKNGKMPQTKTKCHIEMAKILNDLNISFEEEFMVSYWSFDFYLNDLDILIEVDGDYFHSNPLFYKKPKTKTQKINASRDKKKNEFCKANNLTLIRFWEHDIHNNREDVICRLEKLLM